MPELFPGAAATLAALSASYPLMLITKGEVEDGCKRLERALAEVK